MAARTSRRLPGRRWFAVAVLVLVGLLYYRPLHDYFASRAQRAARLAQLSKLQREQAVLERRLRDASSAAAVAAQERLLGYVHPGDQLYIVKNIPQWRRRQNGSRRAHHSG
jgi:cell division protein FtsB